MYSHYQISLKECCATFCFLGRRLELKKRGLQRRRRLQWTQALRPQTLIIMFECNLGIGSQLQNARFVKCTIWTLEFFGHLRPEHLHLLSQLSRTAWPDHWYQCPLNFCVVPLVYLLQVSVNWVEKKILLGNLRRMNQIGHKCNLPADWRRKLYGA